jgi:hypothetical protein
VRAVVRLRAPGQIISKLPMNFYYVQDRGCFEPFRPPSVYNPFEVQSADRALPVLKFKTRIVRSPKQNQC